jgi:hypothetical protein
VQPETQLNLTVYYGNGPAGCNFGRTGDYVVKVSSPQVRTEAERSEKAVQHTNLLKPVPADMRGEANCLKWGRS